MCVLFIMLLKGHFDEKKNIIKQVLSQILNYIFLSVSTIHINVESISTLN